VGFQEIVHSVLTEDAEVAEASVIRRDRMDSHNNARLTPKGREVTVRPVVDGERRRSATAFLKAALA
jgi:hypothetical protein